MKTDRKDKINHAYLLVAKSIQKSNRKLKLIENKVKFVKTQLRAETDVVKSKQLIDQLKSLKNELTLLKTYIVESQSQLDNIAKVDNKNN